MRIFKNEEQVMVERPLDNLRKQLSEHKIDFSSISKLKGSKELLIQAFREEFYENIN